MDTALLQNRHWFGTITVDNIEAVAAEFIRRLEDKRFTFVIVYENSQEIHVHTSLQLVPLSNGEYTNLYTYGLGIGITHPSKAITFAITGYSMDFRTEDIPGSKYPYIEFVSSVIRYECLLRNREIVRYVFAVEDDCECPEEK